MLPVDNGQTPGEDNYVDAPMLGVAAGFEQAWLSDTLRILIGASAFAILVIACNAAMLGLSRLGYSLALNRQIPSAIGRLHPVRATPVVIIGVGALLAILLLIPADLEFLASIYAFGATISFTIVHASVVRLRWREPDRDRPFKAPLNIRIGRGELPVTAAVGGLMSAAAFIAVVVLHDSARWAGIGWMAFGIALYVGYRAGRGQADPQARHDPRARADPPRAHEAEYGSILVPVLGTPLDDDIMQTAGRLSMEENADEGEGGAVIEAVWVFEVPMALPLDARIGEDDLKRARKALQRAKAVGEEYEGVEVATATVRARRAGEGIVREARRRGVEAIVLAAEEPTRVRGGALLGGKRGLLRHLRRPDHALRGDEGAVPRDPHRPAGAATAADRRAGRRASASAASTDAAARLRAGTGGIAIRTRAARVRADVRARRRRRPGRVLRGHGCARARATTSRCSTRTRSRTSASTSSSARAGRRPAGASRSAPRSRWTRSSRPASRRPTSSSPPPTATTRTSSSRRSPSGASTSPKVIARVLDPRRAAWYAEQGAADDLPDADRDRAARAGRARRSD